MRNNGFVADGYWRARAAIVPRIRAELLAEFAERMATASFLGRLALNRELEREVERRVRLQAPPDALY